jgi:hypothetical protein
VVATEIEIKCCLSTQQQFPYTHQWWHNTDGKARLNPVNTNDFPLNGNACSLTVSQRDEQRQSKLKILF